MTRLFYSLLLTALLLYTSAATAQTGKAAQQVVTGVDDAVKNFMQHYHVPGMAVAITRNGRLVYSKGYGVADKATGERITPHSRFRIASVSKSITAVAILKLVEAGKLQLDDKVFGEGAILGTDFGTKPCTNWLKAITVRQLLQHTAGGWTNNASDPMFRYPGLSAAAVISRTLDNSPLINAPGTVYAYSNFGYCVLGRVIEKVSGMDYADCVQQLVLTPAGIGDMVIGANIRAGKKQHEVVYYGQHGEDPYNFNLSGMDAHGGWIASANALARFLVAIDGFDTFPDILSRESIKTMTTPAAANPNYALGWLVNMNNNWWHAGSLPGTASEIIRGSNGFNWVLLCNTRTERGFFNDLDGLIWKVVNDKTTSWPDTDGFR